MENSETSVRIRWKEFLCKSNISWSTFALICLFGLGSWIAVNGLWVELPVLVRDAPEKWNLPSYLAVIFQLANIGPVIYAVGNHFFPAKVHEKSAIPLIISVGAVSCALLGVYWNKTSYIGGKDHSVVLFILSFFLAIVDCTSSVVFLTFMSIFPSSYITALFVGETSSGLLPAFVALGQGINSGGGNCNSNATNTSSYKRVTKDDGLRFGPEGFFFFLFAMMVVCGMAFLALNYLPVAKRQHVTQNQRKDSDSENRPLFGEFCEGANNTNGTPQDSYMISKLNSRPTSRCEMNRPIIYLLCLQAWINCLSNGVLPSIQAYASGPYGDKTYHLGNK